LRDDRADIGDLEQLLVAGVHDGVQAAEMPRQRLGRGLAHMADAQPEKEARQRGLARLLQRIQQVERRFFGHAVQIGQGHQAQAVEVRQGAHDPCVHQLVDQLVSQALDLDGAALREVQDRLLALGAAEQATGAAVVCLALLPHCGGTAHRAAAWHAERLRRADALVGQHAHHLGDHVTGPAHDHRIADAHILATGLVLVVQRGIGDGHAAHEYRRQLGHRREFAGAPDLHVDAQHRRELLLGWVLVRHCPARLARHETQLLLQRQRIDLVDHTVDVITQAVAQPADLRVVGHQLRRALRRLHQITDRQAPGPQLLQHAEVGGQRRATLLGRRDLAQTVGKKAQRPARGDGRVELAHGTGGGVARVDKGLLALGAGGDLLALAGIEALEVVAAHVDLAAHLEHRWRVGGQSQRDLADRADVVRHVFAILAVAAGGRLHQHAGLVAKAHRQPVELRLGNVAHRSGVCRQRQFAAYPGIEVLGATGLGVGLGADAEHGHAVAHAGECIERLAANAPGG